MYNIGIMTCKEHVAWAKRDCNAFMGRRGRIRIEDADAIPAINIFLTALKEREGGFPVLRKSGDIDHGWELAGPTFDRPNHICKIDKPEWYIPVQTIDESRDMTKQVGIHEFMRDDIKCHFPEGFEELVKNAIAALEAGFYKDEMREWEALSLEPDNGMEPDIPHIKNVVDSAGREGRVLVLPAN
jgi:hypothetical protein